MVDPEHRDRFVYLAFEAQILRQLLKQFEIIFTTAGAGTPGVIRRRLGYFAVGSWHSFTPVVSPSWIAMRLTRVGRFAALAGLLDARSPPGWRLDETKDHERLAALWASSRNPSHITPARSAAHLAWRIMSHPRGNYRMAVALDNGTPAGAIIWREATRADGALDLIVDDIFVQDDSENLYRMTLLSLAGAYRGRAARIVVRTLELDTPLVRALHGLAPAWSANRGGGSPFFAHIADPLLAKLPWEITMLVSQGYQNNDGGGNRT